MVLGALAGELLVVVPESPPITNGFWAAAANLRAIESKGPLPGGCLERRPPWAMLRTTLLAQKYSWKLKWEMRKLSSEPLGSHTSTRH